MSEHDSGKGETEHQKPFSLVKVYDAFGLIRERSGVVPIDTSVESIAPKITNPRIAEAMGASPHSVAVIYLVELTANLLDSFSETGQRRFLFEADGAFQRAVRSIPKEGLRLFLDLTKSAMTYFNFEAAVAQRVKNGDRFLNEEAVEYLLRRGADSALYAAILRADGILSPGLIAGFRARQALWDLQDDFEDLELDRQSTGANVLLLSTQGDRKTLRGFANQLVIQSQALSIPVPLKKAIEEQYEKTMSTLS